MREVENPMVIDSLWDELDQVDREQEEEDRFGILADMEYDEDLDNRLSWFAWSRENDGYHF